MNVRTYSNDFPPEKWVFGIPECPCQRLGRTPLWRTGAAGTLLAFIRNWTSALIIRALRRWRDLREGSHRGPAAVVGFDFSFGPGLLIS